MLSLWQDVLLRCLVTNTVLYLDQKWVANVVTDYYVCPQHCYSLTVTLPPSPPLPSHTHTSSLLDTCSSLDSSFNSTASAGKSGSRNFKRGAFCSQHQTKFEFLYLLYVLQSSGGIYVECWTPALCTLKAYQVFRPAVSGHCYSLPVCRCMYLAVYCKHSATSLCIFSCIL